MAKNWDIYGRQGLDLAHSVSSVGFSAAKVGTRLGFSIARGIASTAVGVTSTVLDITLFGGSIVTRPVFGHAVSSVITIAEQITLAPIHLSEYITSTSLLAAHSSINFLSVVFPGSSDASFSLASFIDLVRRECQPVPGSSAPEKLYGITQVARAMIGWVALQGVTQEWQEKVWLKSLKEIHVKEPPKSHRNLNRKTSRIRVTSDVIFPGHQGPQIIAADIGEPEPSRSRTSSMYLSMTKSHLSLSRLHMYCPFKPAAAELKTTLRRLSKMVLAGYGGASLLFFGVSPTVFERVTSGASSSRRVPKSEAAAIANEMASEETALANAIDASEAEAAGDGFPELPEPISSKREFSWWDMLLGKCDQELFELSTVHGDDHPDHVRSKGKEEAKKTANKGNMKATAVVGNEHLMPRFWVLTDHGRGQIVLVMRGTMSLNELAVDLTCEPETFQPASTPYQHSSDSDSDSDSDNPLPGKFTFPSATHKESESLGDSESKGPTYHVHGGILRMARLMGDVGKPVHLAVLTALHNNPDYDLILCGHSLGAGVAAMLGMMWADPKTCLTVRSSGLPVGRRVEVYCFAPPSLTDATLSRLTDKLIVSLVYSNDVVSRLSLGSVRDLKNAAMWLCEAEANGSGEGWSAVTARVNRWKNGSGSQDDMDWFIAMRKTLEANMQNTHMYPPGRVLWAMRDGDLHPAHQRHPHPEPQAGTSQVPDKLRVFEVLNVEKIFSQLVFSRNMLSAHLPHQYDKVIHDLL